MAAELSAEEVERRVSILKRFRELMTHQRDRFRDYLTVLDKQKDVIETGDVEALTVHVEMEEGIVAEILSIQKVVTPLEELYRSIHPNNEGEVPQLKKALEELKNEAVSRSQRNRELLSQRMDEVRSEIRTLRGNPFVNRRSVYADAGQASLVDIKG
ncbi:MAG: flagellar biosynthesis protein FlgN [Treponemataceae bacterium]